MKASENLWELEDVVATRQLDHRKSRVADANAEAKLTNELLRELAKAPQEFFSKLVDAVLEFSAADSAGISLLDEKEKTFVWPAVTGGLSPYVGAGTPMKFGPCGTVLDRDTTMLFSHPERYFTYLQPITPPLEEVLLVPFHVNHKAMGTIWAVIHDPIRKFDREDRRLLETLSQFAASAYRVLTETGVLQTIIDQLPRHPSPRRLIQEDGVFRFENRSSPGGVDLPASVR